MSGRAGEPTPVADTEALEQVGVTIEQLLDRVADTAPHASAAAEAAVAEVVGLYGAGLGRIVALLAERDDDAVRALADDDLVAGLLLLHGLHPVPLERRVHDAARAFGREAPGDVRATITSVSTARVEVRVDGDTSGDDPGPAVLRLRLESLVRAAAPEVADIAVVMPATSVTIPVSSITVRSGGRG